LVRIVLVIFFLLFSKSVISGDWYQVNNGLSKVSFNKVKVEVALWEFVLANSSRKFEPIKSYTFQFQLTGIDTVKINSMCRVDDLKELTKHFVLVDDGGSCYFELTYNIKTRRFSNLYVNGFA